MINEILNKNKQTVRPKVICADGFRISIQASEYHYSTPRVNAAIYTHVELGFPSGPPTAEIMEYAEDPEDPTGTVYGYVPIELVYELLKLHGGFLYYDIKCIN